MSGPKSSRYTLTAEQRRIIMEELRRQQQILAERSRISQAMKALRALPHELDTAENDAKLLQSRTGKGSKYLAAIDKCRTEASNAAAANSTILDNAVLDELRKARIDLEKTAKKISGLVVALHQQAAAISSALDTDIKKSVDKGFTTSFARMKQRESPLNVQRKKISSELDALRENRELPTSYREQAQAAIAKLDAQTSMEHLSNFRAMVVLPLIHQCEDYIAAWQRSGERYVELNARYEALCALSAAQAKTVPFSEAACAEFEELIKTEEAKMLAAEEQTYIRTSIDDVMQEMGYDILGQREVTKRSGKKFRNELYAFSEGTAVNVTYASDGSIVMELGGIDDADRVPSRDESERLCRDMHAFCGEFEDIERRLQARGVVLGTRIGLLPPEASYAQIINTEDYDMKKAVSCINVKKATSKQEKANHMNNE